MARQHEAGHEYGTRERVGEATRDISQRARSSPTGVSGADTGHGVDGHMDRIASQAGMYTSADPNDKDGRSTGTEVRQIVEGYRREMQLAAISQAARRAQKKMSIPAAKRRTVVGGSGGAPLAALLTARDQRTGGAGGQSALTHDQGRRNGQTAGNLSTTGRTTATTRAANRDMRTIPALRMAPPIVQRPMRAGGYADAPLPPPRPKTGRNDNYPGRAPERTAPRPQR